MEVRFVSRCLSVPLVLLALISFWEGIVLSQAPTVTQLLSGILGQSVLLSVNPAGKNVKKVEWTFAAEEGEMILLGEFSEGKSELLDTSGRFQRRLEGNMTTLKIRTLQPNDRGTYAARIKTEKATVEDWSFNLRVYEPVPKPQVRSHSLSITAAGCNVTLECLVPGREALNISWRRGSPLRDLGHLERYQLTPDGRTLRLSLQPNPLDSAFTCMASNPADQSNASLNLWSICQSEVAGRPFWMWPFLTGVSIVTAVCAGMWLWKKTRGKPLSQGPEEERLAEPYYAEIKKRSPPEGNEPEYDCPQERPLVTTVYDQIRLVPAGPSEQLT
ncbi:CD48 antigen-like [Carettochelys insculpta]|uniref:CD48 antigen-like n=1 Tax=Carettochelys insculpta TaxID=44489 RepID=UPI003EBD2C52